jgi:hypothetical protein
MSSGAVIVGRQNQYMRTLRQAGATSVETALPLEQLALRDSMLFRHLVMCGVVQAAVGGRYWLDEPAAEVFVRRRRVRLLVALGIAVGVVLVVAVVS